MWKKYLHAFLGELRLLLNRWCHFSRTGAARAVGSTWLYHWSGKVTIPTRDGCPPLKKSLPVTLARHSARSSCRHTWGFCNSQISEIARRKNARPIGRKLLSSASIICLISKSSELLPSVIVHPTNVVYLPPCTWPATSRAVTWSQRRLRTRFAFGKTHWYSSYRYTVQLRTWKDASQTGFTYYISNLWGGGGGGRRN